MLNEWKVAVKLENVVGGQMCVCVCVCHTSQQIHFLRGER